MYKLYVLILYFYILQSSMPFRLPPIINPTSYKITIKVDEGLIEKQQFEGHVVINFALCVENKNFIIHAKNLQIQNFKLEDGNKTTHKMKKKDYDAVSQMLKFTFDEILEPGNYTLTLSYTGKINSPKAMVGVYKNNYVDKNENTHNIIVTNLETHFARMVFPCFDEPALKANFILTLIYPEQYNALSNTPEESRRNHSKGLVESTFQTTPKMSTYGFAFIISSFTCDCVEGDVNIRVCSLPHTSEDREYSLGIAQKVIKIMGNYTNISYSSLGIEKLDMVGVVDHHSAMENWGLFVFEESILLWNSENSSTMQRIKVARSVTHEIVHNWFGNYVTLKWWDYTFLNEGFATFFEFLVLDKIEKELYIERQFVVYAVRKALDADSRNTSWALSANVSKPEEFIQKFDLISYFKGGSIIRMIYYVVGEKYFCRAIQHYLNEFKFGNTDPRDLYNSFEEETDTSFNFTNFLKTWIDQPGYPLISAELDGSDIVIRQERFLPGDEKSDQKWYIPITFATSHNPDFKHTTPYVWFSFREKELRLLNVIKSKYDWIVLNNLQTGFFRVKYDNNLWKRLYNILKTAPKTIHVINRGQIIDDLYSFAKYSKISLAEYFDSIDFLSEERSYFSWLTAFNHFSEMLSKIYNEENRRRFMKLVEKLMAQFYDSAFMKTGKPISRYKHILVFEWACRVRKKSCIKFAEKSFNLYKAGSKMNPDLAPTIFCTALERSQDLANDTNFLYHVYRQSTLTHEKFAILNGFTCVTNNYTLEKLIDYIVIAEFLPPPKVADLISSILSRPIGADVLTSYVSQNFQKVYDSCRSDARCIRTITSPMKKMIKNEAHLKEFEGSLQIQKLSKNARNTAKKMLEAARNNLPNLQKFERDLENYFEKAKGAASPSSITSKLLLICLVTSFVTLS